MEFTSVILRYIFIVGDAAVGQGVFDLYISDSRSPRPDNARDADGTTERRSRRREVSILDISERVSTGRLTTHFNLRAPPSDVPGLLVLGLTPCSLSVVAPLPPARPLGEPRGA